ncbi:hypothetical protein J1N35_015390 [Gossypium stocksii]|uniref:Aminotransferase-like plant mobile domain-containing protein n=1 Tax=Gossypium stocksii TaxID=47602 RepID=A0A9D3VYC3_9ROSI|nr:hypothetical protein J1N35_015390 [Gossypium stocksii]
MGWLRDTFPKLGNDLTEEERIRYAQAYILEMIGGYLMPDLSRNLVHLRWLLKPVGFRAVSDLSWGSTVLATLYREIQNRRLPITTTIMGLVSLSIFTSSNEPPIYIPTHNEVKQNHPTNYVRIPTALKAIRLLLDQRLEAQTPYEDPVMRVVILEEFFQNLNNWHVKVPLVNYATVKMYKTDRVLRQFKFR